MSQLDTSILVAIITSSTALVSSILSIVISYNTSHKLQKIESKKTIMEYMCKKLDVLRNAKDKLRTFQNTQNQEFSKENVLRLFMSRFELASKLFEEIHFYLPNDVYLELKQEFEGVGLTMAVTLREQLKPFDKNDLKPQILAHENFVNLMTSLPKKIEAEIDKELRKTVEVIEKS